MCCVSHLFVLPLCLSLYKTEQTTWRDCCSLACSSKFNMDTLEADYEANMVDSAETNLFCLSDKFALHAKSNSSQPAH